MISNSTSLGLIVFVLCVTCLIATGGVADAASVSGTVENGTTGAVLADAEITLVNPSAGMKNEQTVFAAYGRFSFESVPSGMYLVQTTYQGVSYRRPAEVSGAGDVEVDLVVYDSTQSWEGVSVEVPHFSATRTGEHLTIERVYDIHNESEPPKTLTGEGGYFSFPVPGDMHAFHTMYASYDGVPVERQPKESADGKSLRLDYPLRPGLTRVAMSYEVGYHGATYELNETIYHDTRSFTIFATDGQMTVSSTTHTLAKSDDAHEAIAWKIENLKQGDVLNLRISGGAVRQAAESGSRPVISVAPNRMQSLSILIMIILGLALLAFFSVATRDTGNSGDESGHFEDYRGVLIKRLAKLDDVYESGAIPAGAYHSKRQELKNQIASLMLHAKKASGGNRDRRKKDSRRKRSSNT